KRLVLTSGAGVLAKVITLLVPLLTVPLALNYLGATRYGLWMTVAGTVSLLATCDLGLGAGLLTLLSLAFGSRDAAEIRRLILNGYVILTAFAFVALVVTILGSPHVHWASVLNAQQVSSVEVTAAVVACCVCFICNIPLSLIQRIQLAVQ